MSHGFRSRAHGRGGQPRQGHAGRGFTLLEVLVAVILLTIGVTGLSAMELITLRQGALSREMTEAMQLTRAKAEELSIVPLPLPAPPPQGEVLDARGCLITGDTRAYCKVPLPGTRYTRTWVIDPVQQNNYVVQTTWGAVDGTKHRTVMAGGR